MKADLAASYAHCQRIARASGSSFYYSFLLLPKHKRLAMCALYAFLRRTDDLGDSADPADRRGAALADWRRMLADGLGGRSDHPVLPALAHTVQTYRIPVEYLTATIDGVEMDLNVRRYETFDDLEGYCQRVASVVGLACLCIWGCRCAEAEWPARRCGLAFQLTNILRDLREDAARDRVYLPREDLQRFDYTAGDLLAGVCDRRFRRLMRFEIERTERLYAEAAELEQMLDADGRRVFGSMMAMYRAPLGEIKQLGGDVLNVRARIGRLRKMGIAARCLLFRPPLPRAAAGITLP